MSLKRLLYTLFLYFIFPLVLIRLLWRSRANRAYRQRWSERLGFISQQRKIKNNQSCLWLHAVSVGEVIAAKPLILSLLNEFSDDVLLVTTTTPTGSDRVNNLFAEQIQNQQLVHVYFPYDLLGSISRFIKAFKPKLLIVVETEIWPNLYAMCNQRHIPVIMVNARLSDKSMKSYLKIKGLVAETLSKVSVIAVRSEIDAERFSKLGANSHQLKQIGNIKYDIEVDKTQVKNSGIYKALFNQRIIFVAASTHAGEDSKILFCYSNLIKQFPNLILVLVPRHPERFTDVYEESVEQLSEELTIIRHSDFRNKAASFNPKINVIVGDSMGEMQMWYSLADLVFIGGSLVKTGGHNPLEATLFGVPVFSGPHMFNFEDITSELEANDLLKVCKDEESLVEEIANFLKKNALENKQKNQDDHIQTRANHFLQQHRGVTAKLVHLISEKTTH